MTDSMPAEREYRKFKPDLSTSSALKESPRRYELDWLRVLGMGIVFLVHCARYFDKYPWHVENQTSVPALTIFVNWAGQWVMPLFMLLAGMGAWYSLRQRRKTTYLLERTKRLLIPLLFGVVVLSPPQVYLERLTHHQFQGSLWDFWPHYFQGWYGFGGNFAWMGLHLWFLLLLYVFACLTLPFLGLINKSLSGRRQFRPTQAILFALALLLISEVLVNFEPLLLARRNFGGWSPLTYLVFYLLGYGLAGQSKVETWMGRIWAFGILIGAAASISGFIWIGLWYEEYGLAASILRAVASWGWLIGILGAAQRWLPRSNRFLSWTSPAVLPVYILHQPIIVGVGYSMRTLDLSWGFEFPLLAVVSGIVTVGVYRLIVSVPILKPLLGLRHNSQATRPKIVGSIE